MTFYFFCLPLDCFLLTLCELNSFFPILGCLSDRNAWFSWMSHTGFCYPRIGSALYIGLTLSFSDYNVPQHPTFVNPILDKISIFFIALTKRGRSAVPAARFPTGERHRPPPPGQSFLPHSKAQKVIAPQGQKTSSGGGDWGFHFHSFCRRLLAHTRRSLPLAGQPAFPAAQNRINPSSLVE